DDLLATFYEKAARDMRSLPDGTPYLPMLMPCGSERIGHPLDRESDERAWAGVPDEPWERINPATATWALAHSIFPGEVFSPDEPIVQNFCKLLDSIDDDEGVPTGTGWAPY